MWSRTFVIILLLKFIGLVHHVHCDLYTSIAGLEDLLESEKYLLDNYENYAKQVKLRNQKIKSFLDTVEANLNKIEKKSTSYFGNPINAFKVLKRCSLDWTNWEEYILLDDDAADYADNIRKMTKLDYIKATEADLIGASKALARLQRTYALEAADIADGILLDYEYNSTLSAHDCFELGCRLYDAKETQYANQWLLKSRLLLKTAKNKSFPNLSDVDILEFLAVNMFDSGNKKMANILNEELLKQDPSNEYGLSNKEFFENEIMQERRYNLLKQEGFETVKEKPTVDKLCEAVCRGELQQTPREQRHLRCRFTSRNVPFCLLAPFKMEELSHDPFVAFYHDAIYDNEMDNIINTSVDFIERSQIGDRDSAVFSEERTSQTAWLEFSDNEFLKPLHQRLLDVTGLNLKHAEPLQVVNYGIGGHYLPHDDFSEDPDVDYEDKGNRILTALFYISDVELGGATAFPFLRLAVPPIRGGLLVWYNMHESLELDYRTRHAGCPVIKGSKWICNEWFHERGQEFTRPCSTERKGAISIKYKDEV